MSDADYMQDAILHCPTGLIRDVTEMLPQCPLNALKLNIMMHLKTRLKGQPKVVDGMIISLTLDNNSLCCPLAFCSVSRVANADRVHRMEDKSAQPDKLQHFANIMRAFS